jgi:hypothetical protein
VVRMMTLNTIERRPAWWDIYPTPDFKPGTRVRLQLMDGKLHTLVALKHGGFRPLLWRLAASYAYGAWLYAKALVVVSLPR